MSTMVVRAGLATTAGSNFSLAVAQGSRAPIRVEVRILSLGASPTARSTEEVQKGPGPEILLTSKKKSLTLDQSDTIFQNMNL